MTTWFITRHPGAIEWAQQQGLHIDRQEAHLDVQQVQPGDRVLGTLPVNLADEVCARGAHYWHLSINLPADARGQELGASDLQRFDATLERFEARKL